METIPSSTPDQVNEKATTPWGALIGILLILGIVVAGAYYALSDRLAHIQMSDSVSVVE